MSGIKQTKMGPEVVGQEVKKDLLVLQGSATYLSKFLGTDGKVVLKNDFMKLTQAMLDEWLNKIISTGEGIEVDLTNFANCLFALIMLLHPCTDADYILSKRSFTKADGSGVFTSGWAGYVALAAMKNDLDKELVLVDIGTGEVKFFGVKTEPGCPEFSSKGQFYSTDADIWNTLFDTAMKTNGDVQELVDMLRNPAEQNGFGHLPVTAIASEAMRVMMGIDVESFNKVCEKLTSYGVNVKVLTREQEALCEGEAIRQAFKNATDLPETAKGMKYVGNFAWGNGSGQGSNSSSGKQISYEYGIGLKTVKGFIADFVTKSGGKVTKTTVEFKDPLVLKELISATKQFITGKLKK
jgi:hypothetical protein